MKLRGRGIGAGIVFGTAALVKTRNGVALMPQVPARIAEEIAARKFPEKPDIILVAESFDTALALTDTIEWGTVIGIVAARAENAAPAFGLPSVVEISDPLTHIPDDALLLLDAARGIVSVNPDLIEIAQFQAESEHINPRKRFFLDDSHQSATTRDGRTIQILRSISLEEETQQAVNEGADGVFCDLALIQTLSESDDILPVSIAMGNIVRELAGKPVIIDDDLNFAPEVLLFAATQGELVVAERLQTAGDLWEFRQGLDEAENRLVENDDPAQQPRFALFIEADGLGEGAVWDELEEYVDAGISRIVADLTSLIFPDDLALLNNKASAAGNLLVPLYVICHPRSVSEYDFDPEYAKTKMLEWLVGSGVSGIILSEGDIQEYKTQIRHLSYEECLRDVLSLLSLPQ